MGFCYNLYEQYKEKPAAALILLNSAEAGIFWIKPLNY
jgi:hypothetical protein